MMLCASTFAIALTFLVTLGDAIQTRVAEEPAFASFMKKYSRTYDSGSEEYQLRLEVFASRSEQVTALNSRPGRKWTSGTNSLSDRTDAEIQRLMGYKNNLKSTSHGVIAAFRRVKKEWTHKDIADLPKNFDWRNKKITSMEEIQVQGGCGSCWALSSSSVLRAHMQIHTNKMIRNSVQQIVACASNDNKCGGSGGCSGSVSELAFDHLLRAGVLTETELPYEATDKNCPEKVKLELVRHNGMTEVAGGMQVGLTGYSRLPENKLEPLLMAVYKMGPVAASLAAGGFFALYEYGIFDQCDSWVINHSVVLAGFGEENGENYYLIQNSWGADWGEGGYMRIQRLKDEDEKKHCGWDVKPEEGSGCKGGPPMVWACGTCGILYHNVIPNFANSQAAWKTIIGNTPAEPVISGQMWVGHVELVSNLTKF